MKTKRFLATALAFAALLALFAACGAGSDVITAAPTTFEIEKDKIVTVTLSTTGPCPHFSIIIPKAVGGSWFARQGKGGEPWAKDTGNRSLMVGSNISDVAIQIQSIQDALALKPDFLTVIPIDPEACEEVLGEAMKNGVIVITNEAPNMQNIHYNVETVDAAEFGAHFFERAMNELEKDKGKYVCFVQAQSPWHNLWAQGLIDYQKTNYPNWELLEISLIEGNTVEECYEKTKGLLQKYPDIDLMWNAWGAGPAAMGRAVDELRLNDKIYVCGVGMPMSCERGLFNGSINFITYWDPFETQYVSNMVASMVLDGRTVKTGDDFGRVGYNSVKVDGKLITGNAWIDITTEDFVTYSFP